MKPKAKDRNVPWPKEYILYGSGGRCTSCRNKLDANVYQSNVYAKYGITQQIFDYLRERQNYRCKICKRHEDMFTRAFAVDHDHACCPDRQKSCGKCVRGLLCVGCNTTLGHFKDSKIILNNAKNYLMSEERYVSRLR